MTARRSGRAALGVVLLASLCAAAIAQERDEDERAGNRVVYATPSKELARLKPMVGTWRSDETWREPVRWKRGEYEGVPGPEGYVTRTVEPGPGELSFRFSEEGRGPMGSVQAAGLVSWDPVRRVYVLDSVSSVFPGIVRLTGAFHGADLVLSGEDTGTGRRRAVRLVLKDPGADGWTETLSEKAEGRWAEVVTRRFRRAPAARDPSSPVPP